MIREALTIPQMWQHLHVSPEQIREFQDRRLRLLVEHAYRNVRHYRRLFDGVGLKPQDIRGMRDLPKIPFTSREELRSLPAEELVARNFDPKRLIVRMSGGSTGEPKRIRRTWMEERLLNAFRFRARQCLGLRLTDQIASVGNTTESQATDRQEMSRFLHRAGCFRVARVECCQSVERVVRRLEQVQPDVITGYAGTIAQAAVAVVGKGGSTIRPRFITTGAETQTPLMRRQIAGGFACPVYNFYSSNEFNTIAWECPHTAQMHTSDDSVIVEVVRGDRHAEIGQRGEVVGTALHSFAMPLIRYKLDDVVTRGPDRCACGSPFGVVSTIQGRMVDYFPMPDGRLLHPYEIIEAALQDRDAWVRQYELIQEQPNAVLLRAVPLAPPGEDRLSRIRQGTLRVLGPGTQFRIELVDQIPQQANGKFRVVRSLVHSVYDGIDWERTTDAR